MNKGFESSDGRSQSCSLHKLHPHWLANAWDKKSFVKVGILRFDSFEFGLLFGTINGGNCEDSWPGLRVAVGRCRPPTIAALFALSVIFAWGHKTSQCCMVSLFSAIFWAPYTYLGSALIPKLATAAHSDVSVLKFNVLKFFTLKLFYICALFMPLVYNNIGWLWE